MEILKFDTMKCPIFKVLFLDYYFNDRFDDRFILERDVFFIEKSKVSYKFIDNYKSIIYQYIYDFDISRISNSISSNLTKLFIDNYKNLLKYLCDEYKPKHDEKVLYLKIISSILKKKKISKITIRDKYLNCNANETLHFKILSKIDVSLFCENELDIRTSSDFYFMILKKFIEFGNYLNVLKFESYDFYYIIERISNLDDAEMKFFDENFLRFISSQIDI